MSVLSFAIEEKNIWGFGDFMYDVQDVSARPKGYRYAYSFKL